MSSCRFTSAPSSSGVDGVNAKSCSIIRCFTAGSDMASLNAVFSTATMSRGMFGGPNKPNHGSILKSGKPASAMVGTSGAAALRFSRIVASARIFPSFT